MKKTTWTILLLALLAPLVSVQAQNTNIDYLTLGASMNYLYEGDADGTIGGDGRGYMIDLSAEYESAHTNYLLWKSNTMDQLISDWTNGTLSASDQQYIRIIQADYLYRAQFNRYGNVNPTHCEAYFSAVTAAGEAAMKKGIRGESLTTNDWENLKVFRIQDDVQNIGTHNLPYKLDMTFQPGSPKQFAIGDQAPTIRLPKLETVLTRSNYTDGVRVDPAYAFYDRGTNRYATLFQGYTTNGASPYEVKALEAPIPSGETTNDFVEIGIAREKPMVLIPCQFSDAYWLEYLAHDLSPIYNAYKEVADFFFINLEYHDVSAGLEEYFGTNAGQKICVMDMETSEELAAEAKNQWMTTPWVSVPTLVDTDSSLARNEFATEGGDAYYLIVDVNGKVAYDGKYHILKSYKPYAKDFSGGTAWANLMERELLKVLENNGEYAPTNVTDWTAFEVGATVADRRTCLITDAIVNSVDAVSNIVVITHSTGQYTLEIGPDTRLSDQEEISTLSTFAPGNTVTVKFWEDTYPSVTCSTNYNYPAIPGELPIGKRIVRYEVSGDTGDGIIHHPRQLNEGTGASWGDAAPMTWAVGTLESISSTSRQITVSLNVDTNAMYGWNFWQEAGSNATLWGDAADNMGVISQWVESAQSGSNWTFVIDDDVDLFVNAENSAYSDLVEGSSVGLLYRTYQNGNQTDVYPEVLRLSLNGLPKIKPNVASLSIPEGSTNSFNVHLTLQPNATVTVSVYRVSGGDSDLSIQSGSSLVFTTTNWETNQPVTLRAAEDDSDWISGTATVRCFAAGMADVDILVTESDNDENPAYALPWQETFENDGTNAGTLGDLDAQHGWTGGGTVQNSEVHGGAQALSLSNAVVSHTFVDNASNIWITLWSHPVFSEEAPENIPADSAAVFYINTNRQLVAYNSTNATTIESPIFSNGWNKIELSCDFISKVWNLSLNDVPMVGNFAFYGSPASFGLLELAEASRDGTSFFDSIIVTDSSDDSDGDGLPDSWENQYWPGDLSQSPGDLSSNGVDTVYSAYIAGFDPTDEYAAFLISDLQPLTSESILEWTAASGRVYTIYWTSNLLAGFGIPMQTNYSGGAFTDATHGAENEGFYKIDVQIK